MEESLTLGETCRRGQARLPRLGAGSRRQLQLTLPGTCCCSEAVADYYADEVSTEGIIAVLPCLEFFKRTVWIQ